MLNLRAILETKYNLFNFWNSGFCLRDKEAILTGNYGNWLPILCGLLISQHNHPMMGQMLVSSSIDWKSKRSGELKDLIISVVNKDRDTRAAFEDPTPYDRFDDDRNMYSLFLNDMHNQLLDFMLEGRRVDIA